MKLRYTPDALAELDDVLDNIALQSRGNDPTLLLPTKATVNVGTPIVGPLSFKGPHGDAL